MKWEGQDFFSCYLACFFFSFSSSFSYSFLFSFLSILSFPNSLSCSHSLPLSLIQSPYPFLPLRPPTPLFGGKVPPLLPGLPPLLLLLHFFLEIPYSPFLLYSSSFFIIYFQLFYFFSFFFFFFHSTSLQLLLFFFFLPFPCLPFSFSTCDLVLWLS